MSINYKYLFSSKILKRGQGYSTSKAITSITRSKDTYTAMVKGTGLYQVTIDLANSDDIHMTCTCPYAAQGHHCKHMAGLLMYIEELSGKKYRTYADWAIRSYIGDDTLYDQGELIAKASGVTEIKKDNKSILSRVTSGNAHQRVKIDFDHEMLIEEATCSCVKGKEGLPCRHVVAALLQLRFDKPDTETDLVNDLDWMNYIVEYDETTYEDGSFLSMGAYHEGLESIPKKKVPYVFDGFDAKFKNLYLKDWVNVEIFIEADDDFLEYNVCESLSVYLRIGIEKMYVLMRLSEFLQGRKIGASIKFGLEFLYNPKTMVFEPGVERLFDFMELIRDTYETDRSTYYYGKSYAVFDGKFMRLYKESHKKEFFILLKDLVDGTSVTFAYHQNYKKMSFQIDDVLDKFEFPVEIVSHEGEYDIAFKRNSKYMALVEDFSYLVYNQQLYALDNTQKDIIKALNQVFWDPTKGTGNKLSIPMEKLNHFATKVLPQIQKVSKVEIPDEWDEKMIRCECQLKFYLEPYNKSGIQVKVEALYGNYKIHLFQPEEPEDIILIRDLDLEQEVLNYFEDGVIKGAYVQYSDEYKLYELLHIKARALQNLGDVYYDPNLRVVARHFSKVITHVGLSVDDYLHVDFAVSGIEEGELREIYKSIQFKKKFVKLKDGSILDLTGKDAMEFFELANGLELNEENIEEEMNLPLYQSLYLEEALLENTGNIMVRREDSYLQWLDKIKAIDHGSFKIPERLEGVLRHYQEDGFRWMKGLAACGMGGVLADDMGLGKTVQAIAFIASEVESGKGCSLVVCPTTLVYNWEEEVERFAPWLKVLTILGTKAEREELFQENFEDYDIIITSYPLVVRDEVRYLEQDFAYCFIDEAQKIKNVTAKTTRSVKRIKALSKFALTGTPIENNLMELWSIYDFILPGYLMKHRMFSKNYERPIASGDMIATRRLKNKITPFMLRRLKTEVLSELPAKIITKSVAHMTKDQKKLYLSFLAKYRQEIEENSSGENQNQGRFKIFAYLTRLRQICCHPSLFMENYKDESGKMELLMELIQDGTEAGHRMLVFSQFTSMLDLIAERLEKEQISYLYLSGATKANLRRDMVHDFQEGNKEVFLISLKAGGTGLNLTRADIVIHVDPWWNPAVEDQATDRAYRIGQKNKVQVYKLITHNSIEEKIYELQEKKKELIEKVIEPGENPLNKLGIEDLKNLFYE